MEFEIKNVKYTAFASEETHCFEATLYIDGKRFCIVTNDGHGGCDNYHAIKGGKQNGIYSEIARINKELEKELIPCSWDPSDTLPNNLEIVVGGLMNQWHRDNEVKKLLRRISYIKNGGLYQIQAKHKPTPQNIDALMTASWWKPEYIMVSGKSVDEAIADLDTINFFGA